MQTNLLISTHAHRLPFQLAKIMLEDEDDNGVSNEVLVEIGVGHRRKANPDDLTFDGTFETVSSRTLRTEARLDGHDVQICSRYIGDEPQITCLEVSDVGEIRNERALARRSMLIRDRLRVPRSTSLR